MKRRIDLALLVCLVVGPTSFSGCTATNDAEEEGALAATTEPGEVQADPGPVEATAIPPRPEPTAPFVVHEWGTYTSVQGSSGRTLPGVHYTEEVLPPFVHRRDIATPERKSVESLPEDVTQKLETPVIYFYADPATGPLEVGVEVEFPDGIVSEWYPSSVDFAPSIGEIDRMGGGSMRWEVSLSGALEDVIAVSPDDVWAPSRAVPDARLLQVGEEHEHFIFYRGLGTFERPVHVDQAAPGAPLVVRNHSDDALPAVFLLHVEPGGRGAIVELGELPAGGEIDAQPGPKELEVDYLEHASGAVARALVESGLYPDEAQAMVDTWRTSYFLGEGTRVLYVAPQVWADELLPLRISPEPDALVRTLVGRIDVLTHETEAETRSVVAAALRDGRAVDVGALGRFAEPRLQRLLETTEDAATVSLARATIASLREGIVSP